MCSGMEVVSGEVDVVCGGMDLVPEAADPGAVDAVPRR